MHAKPDLPAINRLLAIMHRLRAPGGCPWDAEQTHASLMPNLLEEAYEVLDAVQREDWPHFEEELGDLLLQVVFHSEMASESGLFHFDSVAHGISDKLVRRHPHVFGSVAADSPEEVLRQWDEIKRAEKGDHAAPFLHRTGDGLPALIRAAKLQKKAAKVGFDWPDSAGTLAKVREELTEVEAELARGDSPALDEELGDLLFSMVNLVRKNGRDPESLLAAANRKFADRFHAMERALADAGVTLAEAGLERMEQEWQAAKLH